MSTGRSLSRGDLVIVDFRAVNPSLGVRPGLVVQNDADNARMSNTIVAQVTTNSRRAGEATQLPIDRHHSDWASSGLHRPSVVNCSISTPRSSGILPALSVTASLRTFPTIATPSRTQFYHNAFLVVSNGDAAKYGSITNQWEHFCEWKRNDELCGSLPCQNICSCMLDLSGVMENTDHSRAAGLSAPGSLHESSIEL